MNDVDARLAALREATAGVRPSAGFVDRVDAALPTAAPALVRGGRYAVAVAALAAAVAVALAWRAQRAVAAAGARVEVNAALADPEVPLW